MIASVLDRKGPFDGIIAFSQGTVVAAVAATLLHGRARFQAFLDAQSRSDNVASYPRSFLKLQHPPFRFAILYAGRVGRGRFYDWWYEPSINTPFLLFVGLMDPIVEHEERDAVSERLLSHPTSAMVVHRGSHHVPTDKASIDAAIAFVTDVLRP